MYQLNVLSQALDVCNYFDSLAYNLANALFAGTAPLIQTKLALSDGIAQLPSEWMPGVYVASVAFVTLLVLLFLVAPAENKVTMVVLSTTDDDVLPVSEEASQQAKFPADCRSDSSLPIDNRVLNRNETYEENEIIKV